MCMIKEVWKDIPDYPNYQVSNYGRVKSLKCGKEKILKQCLDRKGYLISHLYINSKGKHFLVHRIVASVFIKNDNPTEKTEINHLDENKENNHVDNLCWCTRKENNNYGTHNERVSKAHKGQKHSEETKQKMSKAKKGKLLTEEHKQKLRKPILQYTLDGVFIREWESIKQAEKELNINNSNITNCCRGKRKSAKGFIWKYKNVV